MFGQCKHHLHTVRESYFQHLCFALWFAGKLIWAGIAVIIHAVCPAFFQQTGSRIVRELNDILNKRPHNHTHDHD